MISSDEKFETSQKTLTNDNLVNDLIIKESEAIPNGSILMENHINTDNSDNNNFSTNDLVPESETVLKSFPAVIIYNENDTNNDDNNKSSLNQDDSFDEFQTHDLNLDHSTVTLQEPHLASPSPQLANDDDDEDFADFTSFNPQESVFHLENNLNETSTNETNEYEDDFEDFADFTTTNIVIQQPKPLVLKKNEPRKPNDNKLLILEAFPLEHSYDLSSQSEVKINPNFFEICSHEAIDLWTSLEQIDLKQNFTFDKWKQSASFQHLLEALKIDSRNVIPSDIFTKSNNSSKSILLNPSSSNYDQILQPTVCDEHSSCLPSSNLENSNNSINNTTSDSSSLEVFSTTTSISDNHKSSSSSILESQTPESFNNLTQDLDFFETKYVKNKSNDNNKIKDDLIAEFDEFLVDEADSVHTQKQQPSNHLEKFSELYQVDYVNKIMSTIDSSNSLPMKRRNNEQVLSAEALQILTELPNLSMMRANVLMSPLKNLQR